MRILLSIILASFFSFTTSAFADDCGSCYADGRESCVSKCKAQVHRSAFSLCVEECLRNDCESECAVKTNEIEDLTLPRDIATPEPEHSGGPVCSACLASVKPDCGDICSKDRKVRDRRGCMTQCYSKACGNVCPKDAVTVRDKKKEARTKQRKEMRERRRNPNKKATPVPTRRPQVRF